MSNILQFTRAASPSHKILTEQDLREIDRKFRANLAIETPETPREKRQSERSEALPLTETHKNHRLRQQRHDVWREAEVATDFWRAKMKFEDACEVAQRHGIRESFAQSISDDNNSNVRNWREALMRQLLTPAPDAGSIAWKRRKFASGQHRFTDTKPERIERAIADDVAFLAAHPVRQSRRGSES